MKKSNLYGIIGSVLSCIILFLLLWLVVMPVTQPEPKDDEGLIVSFGDNTDGSGMTEMPAETPQKEELASEPIKQTTPTKQEIITQKDNSLVIAEQKKKETERKEKEALENQRLETEKKIAEQNRKEQEAIEKANAMNGMFGNNKSTGSGTGTGDNNQGNPVGKGNSGGNSWSLNGRSLTGRLVSPTYDKDVEGKITVNIQVDANGNVTSTSIGTATISDAQTRNAARTAAKNTRFSRGDGISSGSITYNFKLK
ncbi:MAG: energy transducer TonB family protein [Paludibacter sp.]